MTNDKRRRWKRASAGGGVRGATPLGSTVMVTLVLAVALQQPSPVVIDRIVAVVAAQPIMESDVSAARAFHLVEVPAGTADPTVYVLRQLIRRTLILAEVDRLQPPPPDETEITLRVDAIAQRVGSGAVFDRALAVTGMTRDQLRRFVRDDLRIRTYLLERFGADRPEAELNAAVDAWIADLRRRTQVTVLYQPR